MNDLFKFILNSNDLSGTNIEKYIELVVKEKAPQIYKPREGKVNSNLTKFTSEHLSHMYEHAS